MEVETHQTGNQGCVVQIVGSAYIPVWVRDMANTTTENKEEGEEVLEHAC